MTSLTRSGQLWSRIRQGASAEVEQAAVDRRDPTADPDWAPWQDGPTRYGHRFTVYDPLRRWQRAGELGQILAASQACADAAGKIDWTLSVDGPHRCDQPVAQRHMTA